MNNEVLNEGDIEYDTLKISNGCRDGMVDIGCIRRYFDSDGYIAIQQVHDAMKAALPICHVCVVDIDEPAPSICCDSCLQAVHLKCIGKRVLPKTKYWYCKQCKS